MRRKCCLVCGVLVSPELLEHDRARMDWICLPTLLETSQAAPLWAGDWEHYQVEGQCGRSSQIGNLTEGPAPMPVLAPLDILARSILVLGGTTMIALGIVC